MIYIKLKLVDYYRIQESQTWRDLFWSILEGKVVINEPFVIMLGVPL